MTGREKHPRNWPDFLRWVASPYRVLFFISTALVLTGVAAVALMTEEIWFAVAVGLGFLWIIERVKE